MPSCLVRRAPSLDGFMFSIEPFVEFNFRNCAE